MTGKINNGQTVTLAPISLDCVQVNDIVLCKVNGNIYLHLVTAKDGNRFQISNNKGYINGWTNKIFGKVIYVH